MGVLKVGRLFGQCNLYGGWTPWDESGKLPFPYPQERFVYLWRVNVGFLARVTY